MANNDIFVQLAEDFGLDRLLEQNDIEPWQVVKVLYDHGLLDIDDYLFTELELDEDDCPTAEEA